jgi:hypothetical protein
MIFVYIIFLKVTANICRWGRTVLSDLLELCVPDKTTALCRVSHIGVQWTYQIESVNLSERFEPFEPKNKKGRG